MRTMVTTSIVFLIAFGYMAAQGSVLYVDDDAAPGGDGSSWQTAYRYLQDALADCDETVSEIHVAGGVYKPDQGKGLTPGDRDASFNLIDGVAIRGGYAGLGAAQADARDIRDYESILTGDLLGNDGPNFANYADNSKRVVTADDTRGTPVLEGFTVAAGTGASGSVPGAGGISIVRSANPILSDLLIRDNTGSSYGAGIEVNSCSWATARPLIVRCILLRNKTSPGVLSARGGGAYIVGTASPCFVNCLFLANSSSEHGGGLRAGNGSTTLVNCAFIGNTAGGNGGAISFAGGAGRMAVHSCTFTSNVSAGLGGGIHVDGSTGLSLFNSILYGNQSTVGQSEAGQFEITSGSAIVSYSCIQGWTGLLGGIGNIGADPLFVEPAGADGVPGTLDDNLRLRMDSPCLNAGDLASLLPDIADLDQDGDLTEYTPQDIEGMPRWIHGGLNMGAYESSDCNMNNVPDVEEIADGRLGDCDSDQIPDDCDPSRVDADGDGYLDDCDDNCPGLFNPAQADGDADGAGDGCDLCPGTIPGVQVDDEGCPLPMLGDFDGDGDIDQSDFGGFQRCLSGPGVSQNDPTCWPAKLDQDGDVDQGDFGLFQRCISGPNAAADRGCTD
ncbi:MAG: hypothetical protein AMXMBFR13_31800 [Phycisphaerae bacterium]